MGKYRFADPDVVRLDISEGDWIEIRKEFSIADELRFSKAKSEGDVIDILSSLVIDWSLVDRDGKKMPCGQDTIPHLLPADALEIAAAITGYLSREKSEEEKKSRAQATSRSEKRSKSSAG